MFPFSYKAVFYNDSKDKYYLECGMSLAKDYADAAKKIESYYGNDLMLIKDLTLYEESELITLPLSAIEEYSNRRFEDISILCDEHGKEEKNDENCNN